MNSKQKESIRSLFTKEFPTCWSKPGNEWEPQSVAILWTGEGSEIPVCSGNDGGNPDVTLVPAFDMLSTDYDTYHLGVHERLEAFAELHGCYWSAYDMGTYLLYEI